MSATDAMSTRRSTMLRSSIINAFSFLGALPPTSPGSCRLGRHRVATKVSAASRNRLISLTKENAVLDFKQHSSPASIAPIIRLSGCGVESDAAWSRADPEVMKLQCIKNVASGARPGPKVRCRPQDAFGRREAPQASTRRRRSAMTLGQNVNRRSTSSDRRCATRAWPADAGYVDAYRDVSAAVQNHMFNTSL